MRKMRIGAIVAGGILLIASVAAAAPSTTGQAASPRLPSIVIHPRRIEPGPNAKRHCRFWLAKQYRVSGTVIVPQQYCWWQ